MVMEVEQRVLTLEKWEAFHGENTSTGLSNRSFQTVRNVAGKLRKAGQAKGGGTL